jgi:hypothetical protein
MDANFCFITWKHHSREMVLKLNTANQNSFMPFVAENAEVVL